VFLQDIIKKLANSWHKCDIELGHFKYMSASY